MYQRTNSPLSVRGQELLKACFRGMQVEGGGYVQSSIGTSDGHLAVGPVVV